MPHASASSQEQKGMSDYSTRFSGVQDDDRVWAEHLRMASNEDARLIDSWNQITDVTLVYVGLFSGVLTAFIIQTSSQFRPDPREVTNQLLIAIYLNQSTPADLPNLLKLDDSKFKRAIFQNSLLYTSLAISIIVAAMGMVVKLCINRFKQEVSGSGPPHLRAKRRQEVYDGSVAWRMNTCVEALPVMALVAVIIFGIFLYSSISEEQKHLGYVVGIIFHLGLSFIFITSITAAFNSTSPFRSPFSDFVTFVFRIFPDRRNPNGARKSQRKRSIRPRSVAIILTTVLVLAVTFYLAFKQIPVAVPLIYFPLAAVFALAGEEIEMDIPTRLYDLPAWIFFSTCIVFTGCAMTFYFSNQAVLFYILVFLTGCLFAVQGFGVIKLSQRKAKTAQADAIAWLLSTSSSQSPDWFEKAIQIAGRSENVRARLLKPLFPLLVPLMVSNNKKDDRKKYVNVLADLVDFKPSKASVWRNRAALEHPHLPPELRNVLEALVKVKCPHKGQNAKKLWIDNTERCPVECSSDAADHILQVLGKDKNGPKRSAFILLDFEV